MMTRILAIFFLSLMTTHALAVDDLDQLTISFSTLDQDLNTDDFESIVAQENVYLYETHLARQRKAMLVGLIAGGSAAALTALIKCIHDDNQSGCPDDTMLWTFAIGLGVGITSGLITKYTTRATRSDDGSITTTDDGADIHDNFQITESEAQNLLMSYLLESNSQDFVHD